LQQSINAKAQQDLQLRRASLAVIEVAPFAPLRFTNLMGENPTAIDCRSRARLNIVDTLGRREAVVTAISGSLNWVAPALRSKRQAGGTSPRCATIPRAHDSPISLRLSIGPREFFHTVRDNRG